MALLALLWLSPLSLVAGFNLKDFAHYLDYVPYRRDGYGDFIEDFRTAGAPPTHIKNRKMETGGLRIEVEDVLANPVRLRLLHFTFLQLLHSLYFTS